MNTASPWPYVPLSVTTALPPTPLPAPSHPYDPSEFPQSLPHFRLNLLVTDNTHLFFAHSTSHLAVYQISRSRCLAVHPLAALPLHRPTTINNARITTTPDGIHVLLLAGGCERPLHPATLSYLHIPRNPHPSFWNNALVQTCVFRNYSAWGLAAHAPTDQVAFSSNSCTITTLLLSALRQEDSQSEPAWQVRPDAHADNIPCVSFSLDGGLLASASIDATFAIFRVCPQGGMLAPALFRSKRPLLGMWSDVASARARCWMVHWVEGGMVARVAGEDMVWRVCNEQRLWRNLGSSGYSYEGGGRASIFSGETGVWQRGGIPIYDDGGEDDRFIVGDCDDNCEVGVGREDGRKSDGDFEFRVDLEEGGGEGVGEGLRDGDNGEREGDDYRLLLVGRQGQLTLYRVREVRGEDDEDEDVDRVDVEAVDSIELKGEEEFWSTGWCLKAEKLGSLGALAVGVTGVGVVVIRILKWKEEKMFVEHVLTRRRTETVTHGRESQLQIIGMCVVERGTAGECGYSVEVWVVWQDATVQCWEIWREGGLINAAVCV